MSVSQLITSFNAGELSPYLDVRSDLEKYGSGCRTLENFITMPYGGVYRRPGTEYLGTAKDADKRCRLVGFNFSTTTRFVLELGELYVRFWSNGVRVEPTPGTPLEVVTPYLEGELRDLQYVQINDVMYFVHPLHEPWKLSRVTDTSWTFAKVAWDWPALLDENVTATTITPSAATGSGITLTASAGLFDAGDVGGYWQIAQARTTAYVNEDINSNHTGPTLYVIGKWNFTTYGSWIATLNLQRSLDGGATWESLRTWAGNSDRNVTAEGTEDKEALLRIVVTGFVSPSPGGRYLLEAVDAKTYGFVRITGYVSATSVTADVVNDLGDTSASKYWSESAWSPKRGYPRTVVLHEGRIFYGGTLARPQSIWGSKVDDFQNFYRDAADDSAVFFTLSASESNAIQWMVSQDQLLIGTAGDEWTLGGSAQGSAITPSSVRAARQSSYGSKYQRALVFNDVILFIQRQGRKVRELVYSFEKDGWVASDLTMLAEHVTKGDVVECAFQQQPDAIYWVVTGDGGLVGMTYERDQSVVGWHRHATQGVFESVATTYGATGDEVWLAVQRVVDGATVRVIERFRPDFREVFEAETKADWWYLDCARRVVLDAPGMTVSGLGHLEGCSVDVLADGGARPGAVVSGGTITLEAAATEVLVGLGFASTLTPMRLETALGTGSSRGKVKRISRMTAALYKSLGGEFSSDGENWQAMPSRGFGDAMDASPPVYSGDRDFYVAGDYAKSADLSVRQTQPLPLTLLALVVQWDVYGD